VVIPGCRAVERLVEAAPDLKGWTVTALKPPRGFDFVLEADGVALVADELYFEPLGSSRNPTAFGVRVVVNGSLEHKQVLPAVRRAIEIGLGERAAATAVAYVEVESAPLDLDKHIRLSDLPKYIEWLKKDKRRAN
jgi:hypothetical protein